MRLVFLAVVRIYRFLSGFTTMHRLPKERQLREPNQKHLCTGRETRGNFDDNEYADLPDLVSMSDSDGEEPECEIVD